MATKNTQKKDKGIGIGAIGLAVAAAVIAGSYIMSDKGKKPRKKIKGWMLRARGEILEGLEMLEEINEDAYNKVVDEVTARYQTLKNVDKKELALMAAELRGQWKAMQTEWKRAKSSTADKEKRSKTRKPRTIKKS